MAPNWTDTKTEPDPVSSITGVCGRAVHTRRGTAATPEKLAPKLRLVDEWRLYEPAQASTLLWALRGRDLAGNPTHSIAVVAHGDPAIGGRLALLGLPAPWALRVYLVCALDVTRDAQARAVTRHLAKAVTTGDLASQPSGQEHAAWYAAVAVLARALTSAS